MGRTQIVACLIVGLWAAGIVGCTKERPITVGSKNFTEQVSSARSWRSIWNIGLAAALIVNSTWAGPCWRIKRSCAERSISIPSTRGPR